MGKYQKMIKKREKPVSDGSIIHEYYYRDKRKGDIVCYLKRYKKGKDGKGRLVYKKKFRSYSEEKLIKQVDEHVFNFVKKSKKFIKKINEYVVVGENR